MRRILSIAGRTLVIVSPVIVLAVALAAAAYVYWQLRDTYQCAEQSEPISQAGKYRIEMTQRVCGGIAFSDTTFLAIRSEQSNQQTTFFSYGGGSSGPKMKWASDNVLVVELSDVSEIYTQADRVGDVQIRYQIGKISTK